MNTQITYENAIEMGIPSFQIRNCADWHLRKRNEHRSKAQVRDEYFIPVRYSYPSIDHPSEMVRETVIKKASHIQEAEFHEEMFRSLVDVAKKVYDHEHDL